MSPQRNRRDGPTNPRETTANRTGLEIPSVVSNRVIKSHSLARMDFSAVWSRHSLRCLPETRMDLTRRQKTRPRELSSVLRREAKQIHVNESLEN